MLQLELVIPNHTGLHARPAKTLVKIAKKFKSKISLQYGTKEVNAKSMLSILTLGVPKDGVVQFTIDGIDEEEAQVVIKEAVLSGLGDNLEDHSVASPKQEKTRPIAVDKDATYTGLPVSSGIAIGPVWKIEPIVATTSAAFTSTATETNLLNDAIAQTIADLQTLHREIASTSATEAEIFAAHLEIIEDEALLKNVIQQIDTNQTPAITAWQTMIDGRATEISQLADPILAGRASDIRDVGRRVTQILSGETGGLNLPDHPVILFAEDLLPSDTVSLSPESVMGFATVLGGPNTHSAILARALDITAVVSLPETMMEIPNGTTIIMNGATGSIIVDPTEKQVADAVALQKEQSAHQEKIKQEAHKSASTMDGHHVEVASNIGSVEDAKVANAAGAEAIGLLRTEFLFLQSKTAPTEEEQYIVYRDIVLAMEGKPVIIRTLDVGGDKPLPYVDVPEELNPFLGERGIRLCLNRPELFAIQLRAIIRAAAHGAVRIMFPMISSVAEWTATKEMVEKIRADFPPVSVELGIMIEVPSAAILADQFAKEVDFFSVGTNDLTQYTLAIDRMHPTLAAQADGLDPAVLRLIDLTVKAAHKEGKWVGVCGELGADRQAIPILVGLGVDELSVSSPAIAQTKATIRQLNFDDAKQLAQKALQSSSAQAVRNLTTQ